MPRDLAPLPSIEYFKGSVLGRVLSIDTWLARAAGSAVLITCDFIKSFYNPPKDSKTPYLDEVLAFGYGLQETGPGAWFAGVEDIKTYSKGIPLSEDWQVCVKQTPEYQSVSLIFRSAPFFEGVLNVDGFEYTWRDDFSPFAPALDRGLAIYVNPYLSFDRKRVHDDLCAELGILPENRIQFRG